MDKILSITRYEYLRHIRRRGFLFAAFGVPLLIVAVFGIIFLVVSRPEAEQRLGLVDPSGDFAAIDVNALGLRRPSPIQDFADEAAARRAFEDGEIDAYVVIPDDYLQTGAVRAVGRRRLSDQAEETLEALLQGLLARAPEANRERLVEPDELVLRTLEGGREVGADNLLLFFLPYGFAFLFFTTTFTTSGYLLQAVTEEKEDRVGEILAVTVSPRQMMAGKIIGLSGVGLTQTLIWVGLALLGVFHFADNVSWLAGLQLPWSLLGLGAIALLQLCFWLVLSRGIMGAGSTLGQFSLGAVAPALWGWLIVYFVLGFLLVGAIMMAFGAVGASIRESGQISGFMTLPVIAPLWFAGVITENPDSMLALVLSLVPITAPVTMILRLVEGTVPFWQLLASVALLALGVIGAIWLAARLFRGTTLLTGAKPTPRAIWLAVRAR